MAAEKLEDTDPTTEIECEIDDLVEEHGSEPAALRAVLHDMNVLLADANHSVSRLSEAWMTAPWELARGLQRPLPDGTLEIVARGLKKDEAGYV